MSWDLGVTERCDWKKVLQCHAIMGCCLNKTAIYFSVARCESRVDQKNGKDIVPYVVRRSHQG